MRIIRFIDSNGHKCLGTNTHNGTAELIEGDLFGTLELNGQRRRIEKLLAPVSPVNIFIIGLNYHASMQNTEAQIPEQPVVFMKPTSTVTNPGDPIVIPRSCRFGPEVDFECELAVVIGRTARDVSESDALQYVLGYTAVNDVTARYWQKHLPGGQTRGKGFDSFTPLGPALVTADEIPNPQTLTLATRLNGTLMQHTNTADMIFPVARLVSYLSQDTTLAPGTVILTGTPPGAGFTCKPPVFLAPGDEVRVELEIVGELMNPVVAAHEVQHEPELELDCTAG